MIRTPPLLPPPPPKKKKHAKDMGANIFHCGGPGTGEVAKLCNNLAMAVQMVGTAEALNMGENLGMDSKVHSDLTLSAE